MKYLTRVTLTEGMSRVVSNTIVTLYVITPLLGTIILSKLKCLIGTMLFFLQLKIVTSNTYLIFKMFQAFNTKTG